MYVEGKGVPQDLVEAVRCYRMAADQGYLVAQALLASMYATGEGGPQDYVQAYMWLSVAASQGFPLAAAQRDSLGSIVTPDQLAAAQRLARQWKPARR